MRISLLQDKGCNNPENTCEWKWQRNAAEHRVERKRKEQETTLVFVEVTFAFVEFHVSVFLFLLRVNDPPKPHKTCQHASDFGLMGLSGSLTESGVVGGVVNVNNHQFNFRHGLMDHRHVMTVTNA